MGHFMHCFKKANVCFSHDECFYPIFQRDGDLILVLRLYGKCSRDWQIESQHRFWDHYNNSACPRCGHGWNPHFLFRGILKPYGYPSFFYRMLHCSSNRVSITFCYRFCLVHHMSLVPALLWSNARTSNDWHANSLSLKKS